MSFFFIDYYCKQNSSSVKLNIYRTGLAIWYLGNIGKTKTSKEECNVSQPDYSSKIEDYHHLFAKSPTSSQVNATCQTFDWLVGLKLIVMGFNICPTRNWLLTRPINYERQSFKDCINRNWSNSSCNSTSSRFPKPIVTAYRCCQTDNHTK